MAETYLITGASGNLGSVIVKRLIAEGKKVRAFVLPSDKLAKAIPNCAETVYGDVRNINDLKRFFDIPDIDKATVIHAAGIVTIYPDYNKDIYDINVGGTNNIVSMCVKNNVRKLVYVSSVHAIPPLPKGQTMKEISSFDPDLVKGFYGKTKAEASRIVTEAVHNYGLNASIVFPSGLCGPNDTTNGHITQLLIDCVRGKLPAGINGGYDFADTRDVAAGIVAAAERGNKGENYILGNRYITVKEVLQRVHEVTGAKLIRHMFPISVAKMFVPFFSLYYKIKKRPPLFTSYSLYTLTSNADFSSEKARRELGYKTRPFKATVADTLYWLKKEKKI